MRFLATRRRRRLGGVLVLLFGLLSLGTLYSSIVPARADSSDSPQSQQIQAGRKLYVVSCASCHGMNAEGGSAPSDDDKNHFAGPPLIGVGSAAVDFQVATGRMPANQVGAQIKAKTPIFSQTETDELAAYINSLGPGSTVPAASEYDISGLTDKQITQGGQLFRSNCTACHNFAGKGGALPYGKYAPSLSETTPKHMYEAMLTGPQQMPVFPDSVLTPQDKREIIGYIVSVRQQGDPGGLSLGRLGPTSEGLIGWLVGIGGLVGVTTWIAARGARIRRRTR